MFIRREVFLYVLFVAAILGLQAQVATTFQFPTDNYQQSLTEQPPYLLFGQPNADYGNKLHTGEDIRASVHRMPVRAVADGTVMFARVWATCPNWGYVLVIEHTLSDGSKVSSIYGHLDPSSVGVSEGQFVALGTILGKTGTYSCWLEHLHFAVYTAAYGASIGQYPQWLNGYIPASEFPGHYVAGSTFIPSHMAQTNPLPMISSLVPNSAARGSIVQAVTINGVGFMPTSSVMYNQISHSAAYLNSVQLTFPLTVADLDGAGTFPVVVTNPMPGGGASNPATFTVKNPVPSISGLSPNSLIAGAPAQSLSINGLGFVGDSLVSFNGVTRPTTYIGMNQLTISLSKLDLATVGTFPVVVTNSAPGGGSSAAADLLVVNGQSAHEWTWMGGSSTVGGKGGQSGVYGTLGFPATGNVPGSRSDALSWTDSNGHLWLFGGVGYDANGSDDQLNDLWEFTPSTNEWAWMGGKDTVDHSGVYGTIGVPAAGNIPGSRGDGATWTDNGGHLWLFGGNGYDANGNLGTLNDLWEFDPSTDEWAWMGGSNAVNKLGVYGAVGSPAAGNIPGSRGNASSWTDSGGHFWLFGGTGNDANGNSGGKGLLNDLWEFDPSTNEWAWMGGSSTVGSNGGQFGVYGTFGVPAAGNNPGGRFIASAWRDRSSNFWLFGGIGYGASGNSFFLNDLWRFNPSTKEWAWMGGSNMTNGSGVYGTLGIPAAGNIPGSRSGASNWTDGTGNLWLFGGTVFGGQQGYPNDLWEFDPLTNEWTWMGGSNTTGQPGVYGVLGTPDAGDIPGTRSKASSWTDSSGNFWLFGGQGKDANGNSGSLNDLWRYQP